ncbi:uncharacterized protein ACHE_41014S [Aspergillus chevalieri]|uniref:Uncharacterized protein n=1 Tax=Aspergillus chevalieri TaxID=182096 RepID=A0A7R7VPK8_ASPCH|nr:uncharacterized protein ACHE_41014S [Aspergillus chevalieri]BCR88450.1 hypothetical protein ACHE_41014S [Aspergillus chevalieri]
MDYQILSASSTAKTKDNWVGPGIYRLTSAVHDGKYLAVDDHNNLVVASGSQENNDPKQQWQIAYAGKMNLKGDSKEAFVTEFFLINVKTGSYLIDDDNDSLTMGVSPPTFNGKTRWILVNRRITEKNQAFDDRYIRKNTKDAKELACNGTEKAEAAKALACNGTAINFIDYVKDEPSNDCQWHIVDNIAE